MRAIDLALAQNEDDGKGHHVEHIKLTVPDAESGDGPAHAEALNAELAASDPSAIAYIGPYASGNASTSIPITNRAGLLQIGLSQTWPGLTQTGWESGEPDRYSPSGHRIYVRLSRSDSTQAEAAAKWAVDVGTQRVVLVSDGSSYSNGMRAYFERAIQAGGLSVVGSLQFTDETLSTIREEIVKLTADAVFYAPSTTQQAIAFARAMEPVNLSKGIFSTDTALNDQFAGSVPDASGAWHIVFNGATNLPATLESAEFSRAFRSAYGSEPGIYATYAYDATRLIIRAVNSEVRIDRAVIASEVLTTKQYLGASGTVSFDTNGDIIGWTMPGYRLIGGLFVLDRTLASSP